MLYDMMSLDQSKSRDEGYDVCIVGAGAAGISLALALAESGKRVALCEAGGMDFSTESQDCYRGTVSGDPYFDLDVTRLRFLGGSTNHWGGWSRPFEEIDFQRGFLGPQYEWPLEASELAAYLDQACSILEIPNDFEFEKSRLSDGVRRVKFQFSPPVRFGEKYLDTLTASQKISLYLNANLVDVDGEDGRVASATFRSYTDRELVLSASSFVFAMGGIENSRFLLWLASRYPGKFIDPRAPVGKYWMEHPHFDVGQALVSTSVPRLSKYFAMTSELQQQAGVLGCGLLLDTNVVEGTEALVRDLLCVAPRLGKRLASLAEKNLVCGVYLRAAWEQAPEITNEIRLTNELDRFGIPRVELRWVKGTLERKTIAEAVGAFNQWLLDDDLGRIQFNDWILNGLDYPTDDLLAGNHHLGGTRMSASSALGVVDGNCKVFGSQNLYIAGSSIFVTGGYNNPTLPIVQFSLRLAEHLQSSV